MEKSEATKTAIANRVGANGLTKVAYAIRDVLKNGESVTLVCTQKGSFQRVYIDLYTHYSYSELFKLFTDSYEQYEQVWIRRNAYHPTSGIYLTQYK